MFQNRLARITILSMVASFIVPAVRLHAEEKSPEEPCKTRVASSGDFFSQKGQGSLKLETLRAPQDAAIQVELKNVENLNPKSKILVCFARNPKTSAAQGSSTPAAQTQPAVDARESKIEVVSAEVVVQNLDALGAKFSFKTPKVNDVLAGGDGVAAYSIFGADNWYRVSDAARLRMAVIDEKNEIIFSRGFEFRFAFQLKALIVSLLGLAMVIGFALLLAPATNRWAILDEPNDRRSISLAQMFWWTVIVVFAFFYVWAMRDAFLDITAEMLVLLGIPAATLLASRMTAIQRVQSIPEEYFEAVDKTRKGDQTTNKRRQASWSDLVSVAGKPDLFKFQLVVFTVVAGAYVIRKVFYDFSFPTVPANLLTLMGISNGAYLGNKIASEDEWKEAKRTVEEAETHRHELEDAEQKFSLLPTSDPQYTAQQQALNDKRKKTQDAIAKAKEAVYKVYNPN